MRNKVCLACLADEDRFFCSTGYNIIAVSLEKAHIPELMSVSGITLLHWFTIMLAIDIVLKLMVISNNCLFFNHTAIAEILNCRAYVTKEKKKILDCLEDERVSQLITSSSPSASSVHVLPMSKLNMEVCTFILGHIYTWFVLLFRSWNGIGIALMVNTVQCWLSSQLDGHTVKN